METLDYREIGERIRSARESLKLTQEEASEKCDITSSFYGNIERGDKKMSVETLAKISRGLGVSADMLLFGEFPQKHEILGDVLGRMQRDIDENQFEKYLTIIKAVAKVADQL